MPYCDKPHRGARLGVPLTPVGSFVDEKGGFDYVACASKEFGKTIVLSSLFPASNRAKARCCNEKPVADRSQYFAPSFMGLQMRPLYRTKPSDGELVVDELGGVGAADRYNLEHFVLSLR